MKYFFKRLVIVGLSLTLILPLVMIHTVSASSQKPIKVVTGLNFYGEVAKAVAGNQGKVTSFINNSSVDPHDYKPGIKQASQVEQANVVIENGIGYDHWMNRLVKSSDNKKNIKVVNVGSLMGKKVGDNEHIWYRPNTMKKLANKLAKDYGKIDPQHADYYQQNAKKYITSLDQLDQKIAQVKSQVNPQKKEVAVSEPVFDYALESLGYKVMDQHFEKAIEEGTDPSPKDIAQIQTAIKNHQIAFFVDNTQASDHVVDNLVKLAKKNHVPVLKVTETKPSQKMTYTDWMMKQYQELSSIQQQ